MFSIAGLAREFWARPNRLICPARRQFLFENFQFFTVLERLKNPKRFAHLARKESPMS